MINFNSIVDCELSAYALDNIVFNAIHEKNKIYIMHYMKQIK